MGDILNEAYAIAQCKECPWYKSCAVPMRLTPEDIRRQIEQAPKMGFPNQPDTGFQNFLSSMASAAQKECTRLEGKFPETAQFLALREKIQFLRQWRGSEPQETVPPAKWDPAKIVADTQRRQDFVRLLTAKVLSSK